MNRKIAIINILLYFIFQFVGISIVFLFFATQFESSELALKAVKENDLKFYFFGISSIIGLLSIIVINYKYLKEKIAYVCNNLVSSITFGVSGYFLMMFFIIAFNLIRVIIDLPAKEPENEQSVNELLANIPLFSSLLLVGIIVPFFEELIFRVSVMGVLTKDKKVKSFIPYLICAIVFALLHDQTIITNFGVTAILNFISYFILSLGLTLIYRFSNHNLLAVFLAHALNNTIATILSTLV